MYKSFYKALSHYSCAGRSLIRIIILFENEIFHWLTILLFPVNAGHNKQSAAVKDTAKLDRETEELHHVTIGLDVGRLIQQGRQEKKMTQKDLATVS